MRIIIDADGCPDIKYVSLLAKKYNIKLYICSDYNHNIRDDYGVVITVSKGFNSADIYIANLIEKGDIVITGDYGVAVLALSKNSIPINSSGVVYKDMDNLLMNKYINSKKRKLKIKVKGPKKRKKADTDKLLAELEKLIVLNK